MFIINFKKLQVKKEMEISIFVSKNIKLWMFYVIALLIYVYI